MCLHYWVHAAVNCVPASLLLHDPSTESVVCFQLKTIFNKNKIAARDRECCLIRAALDLKNLNKISVMCFGLTGGPLSWMWLVIGHSGWFSSCWSLWLCITFFSACAQLSHVSLAPPPLQVMTLNVDCNSCSSLHAEIISIWSLLQQRCGVCTPCCCCDGLWSIGLCSMLQRA